MLSSIALTQIQSKPSYLPHDARRRLELPTSSSEKTAAGPPTHTSSLRFPSGTRKRSRRIQNSLCLRVCQCPRSPSPALVWLAVTIYRQAGAEAWRNTAIPLTGWELTPPSVTFWFVPWKVETIRRGEQNPAAGCQHQANVWGSSAATSRRKEVRCLALGVPIITIISSSDDADLGGADKTLLGFIL